MQIGIEIFIFSLETIVLEINSDMSIESNEFPLFDETPSGIHWNQNNLDDPQRSCVEKKGEIPM